MRVGVVIVLLSLLLAPLGLLSACSSHVPATVTQTPPAPLRKDAKIFLLAQKQRERIAKSLVDAGLNASSEWAGEGYSLTVKIGGSRGTRDCGTVNNVAYVLSGAGQRLMVIKGRGATGTCEPNIFDEMSRTLASYAVGN